MTNDIYERIVLNITEFDAEDVITTSGEEEPVVPTRKYQLSEYESISSTGTDVIPFGF